MAEQKDVTESTPKSFETKEKLTTNEEMASKLKTLVKNSKELPWNQDYSGKENGVNLAIPVMGNKGTAFRGIPGLYLSTVMQLRGLEDPRFFSQNMLKSMNDALSKENKKLPADQRKNFFYGVKKGAKSYLVKMSVIVDKHIDKNGKEIPISAGEKTQQYVYVRYYSAADIVKREYQPTTERGAKPPIISTSPMGMAADMPVKKVHYELEEYKKHNNQLKGWLETVNDVKKFMDGAFEIVKAEKADREEKRRLRYEKTNPSNFKYYTTQPIQDLQVTKELSGPIVIMAENNINGKGVIYTKERLPYDIVQKYGLVQDQYHQSKNTLAVEVFSVNKDSSESMKAGMPLIAAENVAFYFDQDYKSKGTCNFNRYLFTPNKLPDKFDLETGDIVKMNDKMFYVDDNKTLKSITLEATNIPNTVRIAPIEKAELKAAVESCKQALGKERYIEYTDKLQKLLVEGRNDTPYTHYAHHIKSRTYVYGLNKSSLNPEGWMKADIDYAKNEIFNNPSKEFSDIEKEIYYNSPGSVVADEKNYTRQVIDKTINLPEVKSLLAARQIAAEKTAEPEVAMER